MRFNWGGTNETDCAFGCTRTYCCVEKIHDAYFAVSRKGAAAEGHNASNTGKMIGQRMLYQLVYCEESELFVANACL